jgi:hypothetical protein
MMKSRQTVAQQSHRRGMAFGARPHGAKRSLSLLAKVKQQRALSGCFFEVGAANLFWKSRAKKKRGSFDAHPALSCALHAVVVIPMAAKNFSGFMSQTRPTRLRLALQAQQSILHAKRAAVVATMSKMRRVMPRCGAYCA